MSMPTEMDHVPQDGPRSIGSKMYKYSPGCLCIVPAISYLSSLPLPSFIIISLSATLLMNTRGKNKSKHPGIPDMTPSQLSAAGLPRTPSTHQKKLTKNQEIASLKDELRSLRELISSVSRLAPSDTHYTALTITLFSRAVPTLVRNMTVQL